MEEEVEDVAVCSALLQVCELELLDTAVMNSKTRIVPSVSKQHCDVRAGDLVREGAELLELAPAGVLGVPRVLAAKVDEHRVAAHAGPLADRAVRLAVDLGDGELVLHRARELLPDRRELLAVAAPARRRASANEARARWGPRGGEEGRD